MAQEFARVAEQTNARHAEQMGIALLARLAAIQDFATRHVELDQLLMEVACHLKKYHVT